MGLGLGTLFPRKGICNFEVVRTPNHIPKRSPKVETEEGPNAFSISISTQTACGIMFETGIGEGRMGSFKNTDAKGIV